MWTITENGARQIDRIRAALWRAKREIQGLSFLLKSSSGYGVADGDLEGVGFTLERLHKRLDVLGDRLELVLGREISQR